jgi:hypothetical protein
LKVKESFKRRRKYRPQHSQLICISPPPPARKVVFLS